MEKVSSQINSSSSSSNLIIDMAKNIMTNKKRNRQDINFKDYVKTNEKSENNNFVKNRPNNFERFSKNKEEDKFQSKNVKNEDNDTKIDSKPLKNDNKEDDSLEKSKVKDDNENKKENIGQKKKNIDDKSDMQKEKLEDDSVRDEVDFQEIQGLLGTLVLSKEDSSNMGKKLEQISKEDLFKIIDYIENFSQNPKEMKMKLADLLEQAQDGFDIKTDGIEEILNQDAFLKNLNNSENEEKINVSDILKSMKNVDGEKLISQSTDMDIKSELTQLKSDVLQNNKQMGLQLQNFENNNDMEKILDEDSQNIFNQVNNIKILGFSDKIFTQSRTSNLSNEQIQNFSKIIEEMRIAFKDDKTTFNIKLEPESLGKLSVKINSENGILNASFFVESEKAKQAIENQLQMLRQSLVEQGINIQDINVQVGQDNEELNHHRQIMEAINFSKKNTMKFLEQEEFENIINPYMREDLFNDLI